MIKSDDVRLDWRLSIRVNKEEYKAFMAIMARRGANTKQEILREMIQRYLMDNESVDEE